jgi:hypothetical protein
MGKGEVNYKNYKERKGSGINKYVLTLDRAVVGYMGRKLAGRRVTAVAEHFRRDPVGISLGIQKLEARLRRDGTVQGAVRGIEETLTRNRKRKYFITYA